MGSPLAIALAWRGTARCWLGRPGWRQDLHDAVAMARHSNPETLSGAVAWTYGFAMQYGVLRTTDSAVRASEDAVQTAHRASSDRALGLAAYTLAVGLLNRDAAADRHRGLELMMQTRDLWLRQRALFLIPVTDLWAARETARRGDRDTAIEVMRQAVDELRQAENLFYGVWGTGLLVETLLKRGSRHDVAEAQEAIDRLPNLPDDDSAMLEITLLRLRALLARARGDHVAYRDLVSRYRAMAESLGFEGHIDWAEAMIEGED
jgi:ATP/maltotriose-dependent transcriptional regulator MalT